MLEPHPSVRERRPRGRLEPGLPEIVHRLLPQLGPKSVMGEPLDLLAQALPVKRLDRGDDPRVQLAPPLLQESAVRHLVRERVLEGVLGIRIKPGLVEELGALQAIEPTTKGIVRELATAWSSANGTCLPTTDATCRGRLYSGCSRSMRAACTTWTLGGIG